MAGDHPTDEQSAHGAVTPDSFLRGGISALMRFVGGAAQVAHGVVGTAQAYFETDLPPESVISERYAICARCELHNFGQCLHSSCGCFVGAKIRVASEQCPEGKWGPHVLQGSADGSNDTAAASYGEVAAAMGHLPVLPGA